MKLKYENYTEKLDLVIELSEILSSYTFFTSSSETCFLSRANLVRSVHLSQNCIIFVFTDDTRKVLILEDSEPIWSDNEVIPNFGPEYIGSVRLLERLKKVVIEHLYKGDKEE